MKLEELLDQFKDKEIVDRLIKLYPDQKKNKTGYYEVIKTLRNKRSRKTNTIIVLKYIKENRGTDISGFEKGEPPLALDFTSWSRWLAMEIEPRTLRNYPKKSILAHCLWEMTWHGFEEQDIINRVRSLKRMVKSLDERLKKGKR